MIDTAQVIKFVIQWRKHRFPLPSTTICATNSRNEDSLLLTYLLHGAESVLRS